MPRAMDVLQQNRDHPRIALPMPLQCQKNLLFLDEVRGKKVRAHQEEDEVGFQ